ncbi:Hypothetical predicted protein, partial [Paramuricea clavata]
SEPNAEDVASLLLGLSLSWCFPPRFASIFGNLWADFMPNVTMELIQSLTKEYETED